MKIYRTIDHTADIGILVWGKDLKSLFINAAKAMFDQMARLSKSAPKTPKRNLNIDLVAENSEDLLVRWLSELLSLCDCEDAIFTEFKITQLTAVHLKAVVHGIPRKNFTFKTEIKAVTYHHLKILQDAKRYSAQVIFDV